MSVWDNNLTEIYLRVSAIILLTSLGKDTKTGFFVSVLWFPGLLFLVYLFIYFLRSPITQWNRRYIVIRVSKILLSSFSFVQWKHFKCIFFFFCSRTVLNRAWEGDCPFSFTFEVIYQRNKLRCIDLGCTGNLS